MIRGSYAFLIKPNAVSTFRRAVITMGESVAFAFMQQEKILRSPKRAIGRDDDEALLMPSLRGGLRMSQINKCVCFADIHRKTHLFFFAHYYLYLGTS